jgi:hypothetical protein
MFRYYTFKKTNFMRGGNYFVRISLRLTKRWSENLKGREKWET